MIFLASRSSNRFSGSLGQVGEWAISLLPRECWLTSLVQRSENLALGVCLTSSGMTAQSQYLQGANYRVFTQASRLKVACLPSMWITSVWPVTRAERALVAQQFH